MKRFIQRLSDRLTKPVTAQLIVGLAGTLSVNGEKSLARGKIRAIDNVILYLKEECVVTADVRPFQRADALPATVRAVDLGIG
ncbi:hypothetical protein J7K60_00920 [Candidatus Bipolaricaulota bacterium]|nr:hypothetical protein [Candidatus Bipolaricaulota bacterium]